MSNEEIINHGGSDMLAMLWENNRGLIAQMAARYPRMDGVEFDDLFQSGFLAVAEAAERFDPAKGNFLTCLSFCLKKHFSLCNSTASGWTRGQYQRGTMPLKSLNEVIYQDDGDGIELLDTLESPENLQGEADERIYRAELRKALDEILETLPQEHREAVRLRYLHGCTYEKTGALMGLFGNDAQHYVSRALRELRHPRNRAMLSQFLDFEKDSCRHSNASTF